MSACTTPSAERTGSSAADADHATRRQWAGRGRQEANRERLLEPRPRDLVGYRFAERESEGDVDEVDTGRVAHEISHLTARDPRRDLDDRNGAVGVRDQLGKGDPVAQPQYLDRAGSDAFRELELVAVGGRRVDVDPADAEADARRSQTVGERHHLGRATAGDHDPVHLGAFDESLEDALLLGGLRKGGVEVAVEVVVALDPEDTPLTARVCGLQDAGRPDGLERSPALDERADGGERRLRHAVLGERAAHDDLVSHPVRNSRADRRQPEALGHGCDDRNRAVGRDGQGSVDAVATRDLGDRIDVGEVDGLADVCSPQAECIGVAVDGDDADALLARLQDRATLVAPGADEEDGSSPRADASHRAGHGAEAGVEAGMPRVASGRSHSRSNG